MKKYSKPSISVKYFCAENFENGGISSCDYWACLVNSNQHEYVGTLENYSSLNYLLSALKDGTYGYYIYSSGSTTYYIWTSSYETTESTDEDALKTLENILGISVGSTSDWSEYIKKGMVHFTSGVTESTYYSS